MFPIPERIQKAVYFFVDRKAYRKNALRKPAPEVDVSAYISKNVFNWKHPDGRIHASQDPKQYYAVSASVYHPEFRSQVEDGVWPIVNELIQKNYLPLSSCEGHAWTRLYVCVAFGNQGQAENFADMLKDRIEAPTFFVRVLQSYAWQQASLANGKIKVEASKQASYESEAQHLNKLFLRKYDRYFFVEFGLFEFKKENLLFNYYMLIRKKLFGKRAYQALLDFFTQNQLPFSQS